ncbi:MAG: SUMF1/EgtB/PvdO family nonheme iron enzyme [Kiritimatiellia bacterium]|jgi:formylglycine-generating enzyme required for sulfatase activity|nr:SUMF1/EgtB/PvdO family nonheme iron enzyme [Kiritimatiellia bacterium]
MRSLLHLSVSLCVYLWFPSGSIAAAAPCNLFTLIREANVDEVARCLDEDGATLANTAAAGGVTPLHLAAALDQGEIISLLLSNGAWVDAPSAGGFTPLHWAAAEDASSAIQRLIESGADMAAVTDNGITPLHWAASRNATNSVRMLIRAGLAVAAQTESGQTPLHWAVASEAEDSAVLLAFQAVSEGIDKAISNQIPFRMTAPRPNTNLPSTVAAPQPEPPPNIGITHRPPIVLRDDPPPRSGDTRMIALGRDQLLTFVWVPDVELWMGAYEISNGQFRQFRPSHDSGARETFSLNDGEQPAVLVSWFDAQAFCEWINTYFRHSMPSGMRCRLPSNEEWIAVARCGSQRRYPWGNDWPPLRGNHSDSSARSALPEWKGIEDYDDGFPVSCDVTAGGVNEWGIHGLSGNAWEWCSDWYDAETRQLKIRKGGSWDYEDPVSLEIETKGFDTPDARYDTIGFRVVLAPVE